MQDLIGFLVVLVAAVGGAELVRASCRRQLSTPLPVRAQDEQPASVE